MANKIIPLKIRQEIIKRIEIFNHKNFNVRTEDIYYFPEFKGKYLYLKRKEFGDISPIARLTYTGNINKWEFAIFRWSREQYDPDEWFFPGVNHIDGTIEGAMKAGLEAYPI